jgi:hypothetical protein
MDETNGTRSEPSASQPNQTSSRMGPEPAGDESPQYPETSRDARNMAMLCHLLGAVGFIGPLMIWLIEREKHRFVDEHGRAAMNYQVSLLLYYFVSWLLAPLIVGIFLLCVLTIMHVVLTIIGAVKASRGEIWRYPIAISFLK